MKKFLSLSIFILIPLFVFAQSSILEPDSSGKKLKEMYLNMHVEKFWLAGTHVNWLTGEPDLPNATTENTTHCSAFIAAACQKMGIYILRPPEHAQELLANAQYNWLISAKGYAAGWKQIKSNSFEKAQRIANRGFMVLATYRNPIPKRAGHIVCVMPAIISTDSIAANGPQVIQAARSNEIDIHFRDAFHRVIKQWPKTPVLFFYNEKLAF